jgi:hypothetical protein
MPTPKWSSEQVEALRTMAGEQRLSASKIARALTAQFGIAYSDNAVRAKLYRLREEEPRPPEAPRRARVPRRIRLGAEAEYHAWVAMKMGCRPGGYWHGAGITVCERWMDSFETFLGDMGLKPSPEHVLTRIDRNNNFEPGNCRWATRSERQKNRRTLAARMNQLKPLARPRPASRRAD